MPVLTDANIIADNGALFTVDGADAKLNSKNEYGEAFGIFFNHILGTPDPRIFSNHLTQKVMHAVSYTHLTLPTNREV